MTYGEYLGAGSATTKGLYHLNGNSTDSSGNGNNGTDTSITYSLANGKFGQGAGFNGTSSYINLGTAFNGVFNQSAWTISLWSNLTTGSGTYGSKYIANDNNSGTRQFSISLTTTGTVGLEMYSSPNVQIYSTLSVPSGWYNLVVTYGSSTIKVYVNNVLFISSAMNILPTTTNATNVGRRQYPSFEGYFGGNIDELIIENVTRDSAKLTKYYTYTKGRFGIV